MLWQVVGSPYAWLERIWLDQYMPLRSLQGIYLEIHTIWEQDMGFCLQRSSGIDWGKQGKLWAVLLVEAWWRSAFPGSLFICDIQNCHMLPKLTGFLSSWRSFHFVSINKTANASRWSGICIWKCRSISSNKGKNHLGFILAAETKRDLNKPK